MNSHQVVYKHQAVNDLAWLFNAPMIVADLDLRLYWLKELSFKLKQLDESPESLLDDLENCKSHFLGAYFEVLFSFAIRHFSTLDILLEHQQLICSAGTTLGEIDMLVKSPEGKVFQFEIALKYFLEVGNGSNTDWIGPNKTDSLSKKTHKARSKQLTVLDTDLGKKLLKSKGIESAVDPVLLIFGYLFHDDQNLQPEKSKEARWIYFNQFDSNKWGEYVFCELAKLKWITHKRVQLEEIASYKEVYQSLNQAFETDIRPKMYFAWKKRLNEDNLELSCLIQDHRVQEPMRIFVVPDEW